MSEFALEKHMTPIVAAWLRGQRKMVRSEIAAGYAYIDLAACRFNPEMERLRISQRQASVITCANSDRILKADWWPLHDRLVTVELKLSRVGEVIHQAAAHSHWSESYVALPGRIAVQTAETRRDELESLGVGLLAVGPSTVAMLIRAPTPTVGKMARRQALVVEGFWRHRKKLRSNDA